jgi:transcriptional regulator with XRE-family HTH domain
MSKDRASSDVVSVDPHEIAELIGLADAALLGPSRCKLPVRTVAKLRENREDAELTTGDVGAILGISRAQVTRYTSDETRTDRLPHRRRLGTVILVRAGDLAAFIEAKSSRRTSPVVPPTARDRKAYERQARKVMEEVARRHNIKLPPFPAE